MRILKTLYLYSALSFCAVGVSQQVGSPVTAPPDARKGVIEGAQTEVSWPSSVKAGDDRSDVETEATSLLNAVLLGDYSKEPRALALVAALRSNSQIPPKRRIEAIVRAELVRQRPLMADAAKLAAAREQSARDLIAEFPGEIEGYELFLRVVENEPDPAKATKLAQELLALAAPKAVREAAAMLMDRNDLIGKSLAPIVRKAIGSENPVVAAEGKRVILYTWASWSPGSYASAIRISENIEKKTILIGLNVDHDTTAARAIVDREGLPGLQMFDERGLDSPLVRALRLSSTLVVIETDADGVIKNINPHN